MEKRDMKEMKVAREKLYAQVAGIDFGAIGYEMVGMGKEGFIVKDAETGLYAELKVVAKGLGFDAEDALQAYEDSRQRELDRKAKHDEKVAKAEAKRVADKAKAEKEVEAEAKN